MALPSSRMPKELMEEEAAIKAAKVEEEKRKQLVIRISKTDIFKRCMKEWYDSLNKKEKLRLTPLKLKRRAIYVCAVNDIIYDNLPLDWVDEMRTKCGLKLYQKKKRTHDQVRIYQILQIQFILQSEKKGIIIFSLFLNLYSSLIRLLVVMVLQVHL